MNFGMEVNVCVFRTLLVLMEFAILLVVKTPIFSIMPANVFQDMPTLNQLTNVLFKMS